jgi:hypothetical protein
VNPKTLHRNVIPATPIAVAGVLTSGVQIATAGRGIRFYVTVAAGATAGGGTDEIFLCGVPPSLTQGITWTPPASAAIPLVGFAAANALSVAGTYVADFYPGAWLPPTLAQGGALIGAAGIEVPIFWAVRIQLGAGNAGTITVDAELLP